MNLKESFGVAKLSLFNVRLIAKLDNERRSNAAIDDLVKEQYAHNNLTWQGSMINQSHFIGHAYVCLVWLREVVIREKADEKVNDLLISASTFDFDALKQSSGPRQLLKPEDKLRLIRNALSHGKVNIEDHRFVFSDINRKENKPTELECDWPTLGMLTEAYLFAVNKHLYP